MPLRHLAFTSLIVLSLNLPPVLDAEENTPLGALTLPQASELFYRNNRELLLSRRNVEGAKADSLAAAQRPNPTFSLNTSNFSYSRSNGSSNLNDKTLDTIARIDQPIERGNKRGLRMAMAASAVQASKLEQTDSLRQQKLNL